MNACRSVWGLTCFSIPARRVIRRTILVLPTLSREQINDAARAQLSLDGLTRWLIRQSLSYRFTLLEDAAIARAVERQIQREGLIGQPPFLNPLRGTGG